MLMLLICALTSLVHAKEFSTVIQSRELGTFELKLELSLPASLPAAQLVTSKYYDWDDKAAHNQGEWLCRNSVSYPAVGEAKLALTPAQGGAARLARQAVGFSRQEVTTIEESDVCEPVVFHGPGALIPAGYNVGYVSFPMGQNLYLNVAWLPSMARAQVTFQGHGTQVSVNGVKASDLMGASQGRIYFHVTRETRDGEGRLTTSFLEQGETRW